ncbi:MAG: macro domain-containing protein [Christensenellales bacterium]
MPLQIIRQDITKMRVDAIVNTTNEEMVGYSGVDFAVHTMAGRELDEECARIAPLGVGQAKITGAYKLPCKYIIHTSGPVWQGGLHGESILLRSCYVESLKLAVEHGCNSVAVPLISSGVYQYPKDQVLKFAVRTISEFLYENELTVYICVFDKESYSFSRELFDDIREFIDDEYADEHDEEGYEVAESLSDDRMMLHKCREASARVFRRAVEQNSADGMTLREYLGRMDKSFQEMLFELIDRSGMTDVECYKRANVDKRTFSKIKSNENYRPSKQTVIAFAISLKLNLEDTQALLATVGYTLSRSNVFDKIIRYFIHNNNYNIFEINEALFEFDQSLLGTF